MKMNGHIIKMLEEYNKKERISFSMPGHKGGKGIKKDVFKLDVTELYDTDSLHNKNGAIKKASEAIAKIAGADESFIMVNGSTGGIFTMLSSVLKRGDKLLVSRACHMSVINACVTLGIEPVFCEQKLYKKYSLTGEVNIDDLEEKLEKYSFKAVIITSPNYFGMVSDIKKIAEILNKKGIPLLVDAAHGAHFFAGDFLPQSPVRLGADMVIESTHKTLNALNQSAVLHVKYGKVDIERVREMSMFFQTSSPSYPIAATAESAIKEIEENKELWEKTYKYSKAIKEEIRKNTDINIPGKEDGIFDIDETRLLFNFSNYDITGYMVCDILRDRYNIDVEMADRENIVLIATPSNEYSDFCILKEALCEIVKDVPKKSAADDFMIPSLIQCKIPPQDAFYRDGEYVELSESLGRISVRTVVVYPPAVPVIVPGTMIEEECIKYLKNCGGEIIGLKEGKIKVVKEG